MKKFAILHPVTTASCPFQPALQSTCRAKSPVPTWQWVWLKSCLPVGLLESGSPLWTLIVESPSVFAPCPWWAAICTPSFRSFSAMCAPLPVWSASLATNAICAFTITALRVALLRTTPVPPVMWPCQVFSIWCRRKFTRKWKSSSSPFQVR